MVLLIMLWVIGFIDFLLFSFLKSLLTGIFGTYLVHHISLVCQPVEAFYSAVGLLALIKEPFNHCIGNKTAYIPVVWSRNQWYQNDVCVRHNHP